MKSIAVLISKQRMLAATNPAATEAAWTVHSEGIQASDKQDTGHRYLRCITKE